MAVTIFAPPPMPRSDAHPDIILIGGGIMSAHVGTMLKRLDKPLPDPIPLQIQFTIG